MAAKRIKNVLGRSRRELTGMRPESRPTALKPGSLDATLGPKSRWGERKPQPKMLLKCPHYLLDPHFQKSVLHAARNRQNAAGCSELHYSANHLTAYK